MNDAEEDPGGLIPVYLLCGCPTPWTPREELDAYLSELRGLDQRSEQVKSEIAMVEDAIRLQMENR